MAPEIILSLLDAEKGFTGEAMKAHYVEFPETREAWNKLTGILTPLYGDALELASEYGAAKERDGFINGFRLAASLMLECLPAPPHRSGAVQRLKCVRVGHRREEST